MKSLEMFDIETTIVIVSPIHGFSYPKITFDFIKKLPKGNNQVVLMATRAGMRIVDYVTPGLTGIAFFVFNILLKSKGYRVIGQIPFDMPSNWFFLHPALSQKTVEIIFEKNHFRVKKHTDKLFSTSQNFLSRKDVLQDILISPVSLGYSLAIELAHGLILILSILSSFSLSYLSRFVFADFFHSAVVKIMIFTILLIVFLLVFYRVQHILLQNKYLEKLIIFTSLTHYKVWSKRNPKKYMEKEKEKMPTPV
ncbi:hypothetical protein FACS189440_08470 [Bacteroidia bacterium]|nr:hypothetical protein FACS189440_08470 [Bacteroidia bacterium]